LGEVPRDFTGKSWVVVATINYRDTPSQARAHRWARTPTPSLILAVDLADAVQGRDRSSSSELRSLDSIDARFHISQDTLSRRRRLLELSKNVGI
jgi:hypothetical protein